MWTKKGISMGFDTPYHQQGTKKLRPQRPQIPCLESPEAVPISRRSWSGATGLGHWGGLRKWSQPGLLWPGTLRGRASMVNSGWFNGNSWDSMVIFRLIQWDFMGFHVFFKMGTWFEYGIFIRKRGRRWNFDDFPELFHGTIGGKSANHAEFSWDFPGDRLKPMVFINVGLWGKISRPDHDPALHDGWEWTHHLA